MNDERDELVAGKDDNRAHIIKQEIGCVTGSTLWEKLLHTGGEQSWRHDNPTQFKLIRVPLVGRVSQYRPITIFIVRKLPTAARRAGRKCVTE